VGHTTPDIHITCRGNPRPTPNEVGGSTDVGGHPLGIWFPAEWQQDAFAALGLDVPETEERSGRDLRFGIVGLSPALRGEDVGATRNKRSHHGRL